MGKFLLLFSGLFIFSFHIRAQSCFAGFAGPDTTVPCGQTCINLHVTVPDLRSTDDYTVKPIQYNPYPFVTTAPALSLSCANQDDKFFTPSVLPFTFCFYGLSYNSLVVGTNGLVTFDMADSLNCNHWSLTGGSPIPYTGTGTLCGTSCPSPSGVLYPRACIFGVYHDIDIDYTSANKKMEFRIEGNAPCRRAVISFNEIPYFSCTTITATHEIVIYESTGIVEIYIKDKPLCAGWNSGYAVAGIQNWNRDQGLAPPGRNLGSWGTTGMNEAWQFKPNGVSSLLDHVELYDHGSLIGTGTVGVSSNGNIDITFPNICPATVPNSYTVRAYYKKCNDDPTTYFIEDDVVISGLGGLPASATSTPANCAANNGTITVTPTGGVAPFSYTLNGGASQLSNIFSGLAAGTYTVVVTDATGCSRTLTVIVGTVSNISANAVPTATSCPGVNNGKITVTPVTGTAPFMYSINGGTTYQVSNIFTLLAPGTYTITFKDANGCVGTTTATIIAGTNLQSKIGRAHV